MKEKPSQSLKLPTSELTPGQLASKLINLGEVSSDLTQVEPVSARIKPIRCSNLVLPETQGYSL